VFFGSQMSAGYAIEVVGAAKQGAALVVQYRERRPGPDAIAAQVITSPYHLVAIPRVDGDVRFERVP
jgi:hypothetical protein